MFNRSNLHCPTYTLVLVVLVFEVKLFVVIVFGFAQMPQLPPLLQYLQPEQLEQAVQGVLP
ncbi:MAG: hypothetical protein EOO91_06410 [Pedobacter sp.]|nr:MAG: hypothetical protein EOO91_06410 [Pedobacter sp.]